MIIDIQTKGGIGLMGAFAQATGATMDDRGVMIFPESFAKGHIHGFYLNPKIRMMVHQYELKEELTIRRRAEEKEKDTTTIAFVNVLNETKSLAYVQVTSTDIYYETYHPAGTKVNFILIAVHTDLLKDLLYKHKENALLQHIMSGEHTYRYEEIISPEMHHVAAQIIQAKPPEELHNFYFRVRAEELIYLFFAALLKREHTENYPVNSADVNTMYKVRDKILVDLAVPPDLTELSRFSGMSESKMQRLFKQIFGNSIYNYYQAIRMNEAAYLIKEEKLSVSETGYRLGFSNLSHFTRMFERHIGHKPKKYGSI